MVKRVRLSKNRETIYDFLSRAKRFHCTVTSVHDFDVTDLMEALARDRQAGRAASLLAALVRATGLLMERYPQLNRHLFHGPFGKYEVDFEEIVCTLIVLRRHQGELILLPLNIARPHELSIAEIHALIARHRRAPLAELPEFQGIERMKRLPRPATRMFSYLCRSQPAVYRRFFGTYGISPLFQESDEHGVLEGQLGVPSMAFANTCTAFVPATVVDAPRVVDGHVVIRKMLTSLMALDHFLVDGHDGFMAVRHLHRLLGDPAKLGLGGGVEPETAR